MRHEQGYGTGTVLLAFAIGGLVGAGLATLLTPISGPEARRRLGELKDTVRERAGEYAHEASEKVEGAVSRGKEYLEQKKSIVSAAVEAGKTAYEKEKEKYARSADA